MKTKLIHELKSFLTTFLAVFAVEAYILLIQIYKFIHFRLLLWEY